MSIRWGIIGCGDVTEVKSGPGFQTARDSSLTAVMRRNGTLAQDFALRHNVPRWYDDAEKLINDPDVDAVYIATPPGSHLEYALMVCAAGKPAYVEKPMARSYQECVLMTEAFERAGTPLFVAYYRRSLARFIKAKDLIDDGAIGDITGVNYRFCTPASIDGANQKLPWPLTVPEQEDPDLPWRLRAELSGGGLFLDLGCHTLDIIAFMVGDLHSASGVAANRSGHYAVEDGVAICFETESGAPGSALWNFTGACREDIIEITGINGRISLSTFGNECVKLYKGTETVPHEFDLPNPKHIQGPMIQSIVDDLLGRGMCPSTGQTAQRTSLIIDIALDSYYGGRSDAFWNRPESLAGQEEPLTDGSILACHR